MSVYSSIKAGFRSAYETIKAPRASLLSYAVRTDSARSVRFALFLGADINAVDPKGNGFLHQNISKSMIDLLIDSGIEVNKQNQAGDTAMHFAIRDGDTYKAKVLSDKNASVNSPNINGRTAIQELIDQVATINEANRTSVADKFNLLANSVLASFKNVEPANAATQTTVNAPEDNFATPGFSLIHYVAQKCNAEGVRLVATLTNANSATITDRKTPLMYAAAAGNLAAIPELANVKANPTLFDSNWRKAEDYVNANDPSAVALKDALLQATPTPILEETASIASLTSKKLNHYGITLANAYNSVTARHAGYFAAAITTAAAIAAGSNILSGITSNITNRFKSSIKCPQ